MQDSLNPSARLWFRQTEQFEKGVLDVSDFLVTRITRIAESITWVDMFGALGPQQEGDLRSWEAEDVI
jgi:hypothetical protein